MTPEPPARLIARERVNLPSLLVMATGVIGALYALSILAAGAAIQRSLLRVIAEDPRYSKMVRDVPADASPSLVFPIIGLVLAGLTLFGAVQMRGLKSYGLAVAGVAASMVLVPGCCCWGIPAGLWAVVVLMKPEVKSQFVA